MAIWPFGRRPKRHTIQLDTATDGEIAYSHDSRHSLDENHLGIKPSRKQSKRQKNRHPLPVDDYPTTFQDVSSPSRLVQYAPSTTQSERIRPFKGKPSRAATTGDYEQPSLSRNPSLLKPKRNENQAVLKKRLSKRKAYEIAREREIRLMASSPIDIPRRATTPLLGDDSIEDRRGQTSQNRRFDRNQSEMSLSMHDSTGSSLSEFTETYTFKVNSFAAWTPRPVIRYVEAPRISTSRNQRTPDTNERRSKTPVLAPSEENLQSKKRIDELADDLDAGALRELMERDRRRRERKQIEEQERLQRKLHRNAKQQKLKDETNTSSHCRDPQNGGPVQGPQGRPVVEGPAEPKPTSSDNSRLIETDNCLSGGPTGSWLRDTSGDGERNGCESLDSAHVIGNLDDSSIQEPRPAICSNLIPSHEMTISRTTLSASLSPSRHGVGSPNSSQFYSGGRESASDLSRTYETERRLSENSTGRVNTISSIFRRGSSRLKKRYQKRFPDRTTPLEKSNVSHESFFKVHTQQSAAPAYVPPKALLGSNAFKRSQSKFTEHFGEEPLSPPDSRLQSPDPAGEQIGKPMTQNEVPDPQVRSQYPIASSRADSPEISKNRHHSWAGDGLEDEADNVPLSQSLASIDSEGSWMSGQFLRRISQKPSSLARPSLSSTRNKMDEGQDKSFNCDEVLDEDELVNFGTLVGEASADSSNASDQQGKDLDTVQLPSQTQEETWHEQIAKRPVLVNPTLRPRSNEGLLNSVQSLSPISAEDEYSPIEDNSSEIHFAPGHKYNSPHAS